MDKILTIEPENVEAVAQKAMAYDLLGETEKAFAAYEKALEQDPDNKDLLFNLGRLYFMKKDYENASEKFKTVIEKNPDDYEANLNVGNAYLSVAEDLKKELQNMDEKDLAKMSEKEIDAKQDKIKEYYKMAVPYLEKAVELKPDSATLWNNLGVAYINAGMQDEGTEAFKKAEELQ